jgi:hypothetical protein
MIIFLWIPVNSNLDETEDYTQFYSNKINVTHRKMTLAKKQWNFRTEELHGKKSHIESRDWERPYEIK